MSISSLANIHPDAKIADNVTVDAFTSIYENVEIGKGTWIGPNVTIMQGARIGKNCKIFPGSVISGIPQDLKFSGEDSIAIIGDNTVIREFVTVNRGTVDKNQTKIGANCLLMAYVHIAHDCLIGDNCILANNVQMAGHVIVDNFANIGGISAIRQFVRIGSHVMISGGCLVRKDVPPYVKAAREPMSFAGINSIGLKRRGFSNDKINEIQEIYRHIYQRGLNNSKAIEIVENEVSQSSERDMIVSFIKQSERGIMKGFNQI